jgi:hypothetical protein
MTHLEPVIIQKEIVPYFDIIFNNTLPEGETEFTFSFDSHPGYDHWEVQCMEGDTDWEVKPDGWFQVVMGWGEETYLTPFHHLNQIINLSFERQHVMKVGTSGQLKLRGRRIALMDKA